MHVKWRGYKSTVDESPVLFLSECSLEIPVLWQGYSNTTSRCQSVFAQRSFDLKGFRKCWSSLSQSVAKWQSALKGKKFNTVTWLKSTKWSWHLMSNWSCSALCGNHKPMPLPSGKILISFNILPFLNFSLVLLGILPLCDQVLLRSRLGTHWLFSLKAGAASCLWLCFDLLKCHSDGCRGWYFPQ